MADDGVVDVFRCIHMEFLYRILPNNHDEKSVTMPLKMKTTVLMMMVLVMMMPTTMHTMMATNEIQNDLE